MVITDTYRENAKLIKNMVAKSFSLSPESYKLFCEYIDDPTLILNDKAKELLKKYSDEVVDFRIPLDTEKIIKDEAMKEVYFVIDTVNSVLFEFYREYRKFDNGCKITYDSVLENKITVFGTERKVYRFLCSHSKDIAGYLIKKAGDSPIDFSNLGDLDEFGLRHLINVARRYHDVTDRETQLKVKIAKLLMNNSEGLFYDVKTLSSTITDLFRITADIIGSLSISNKNKYKSYLTFNFADWFLASTGENWTSCINLDSCTCFSWGLIGPMSCPDWGMVMVTRSDEKEWLSIKVPSIVSRTWVIYGDNEKYNTVNWYPHDLRSRSRDDLSIKNGDIVLTKKEFNEDRRSFSWYKPFYLENGTVPFIYADCYGTVVSKTGENIRMNLDGSKSGMPYVFYCDGVYSSRPSERFDTNFHIFSNMCDNIASKGYTMENIIIDRVDALEIYETEEGGRSYCECCEEITHEDDLIYVDGYGNVCTGCLESDDRFIYCDHCNVYRYYTECVETYSGEYVCSECYENYYFHCDNCNEVFYKNDELNVSEISDNVLCNRCYEEEIKEDALEKEKKEEEKRDLFYEEKVS